jgi:hypothetical protein
VNKLTPNQLIVIVALFAITAITVVACVLGADAVATFAATIAAIIAVVAGKLFTGVPTLLCFRSPAACAPTTGALAAQRRTGQTA